jgi:hypothetical protein
VSFPPIGSTFPDEEIQISYEKLQLKGTFTFSPLGLSTIVYIRAFQVEIARFFKIQITFPVLVPVNPNPNMY